MNPLRPFAPVAVTLAVIAASACGSSLDINHTETPCIAPGQPATVTVTTMPGTQLTVNVQDDFGGTLGPAVAPLTTDASGKASFTWQSPAQLSTTTLHFIVNATHASDHASRDIHVVVGGNGRSC